MERLAKIAILAVLCAAYVFAYCVDLCGTPDIGDGRSIEELPVEESGETVTTDIVVGYPPTLPIHTIADDEAVYLMSHLINAEGSTDEEIMYGVGSVALNRTHSADFPDTLYEVIYQDGQYECTWNGHFEKEPSDAAVEIATDLLINGSTYPPSVVWSANFPQGSETYKRIGNMYFCK